jgi:quercetin dioxygenase-like cupin family protein
MFIVFTSPNSLFFFKKVVVKSKLFFVDLTIGHGERQTDKANLKLARRFPEVITCLPTAEIKVKGAKAWVLQSDASQLVFFEFKPGTKVPEHQHNYPQWGIVVEGEMELVVGGETFTCKKGTEYLIPAGAKHYVRFLAHTRVMDYFSEKNRYAVQEKAKTT